MESFDFMLFTFYHRTGRLYRRTSMKSLLVVLACVFMFAAGEAREFRTFIVLNGFAVGFWLSALAAGIGKWRRRNRS